LAGGVSKGPEGDDCNLRKAGEDEAATGELATGELATGELATGELATRELATEFAFVSDLEIT
jgi:hypothetical protein